MAPIRLSTASVPAAGNRPTTAANDVNRFRSQRTHGSNDQSFATWGNVHDATVGGDPAGAAAGQTSDPHGDDGPAAGAAASRAAEFKEHTSNTAIAGAGSRHIDPGLPRSAVRRETWRRLITRRLPVRCGVSQIERPVAARAGQHARRSVGPSDARTLSTHAQAASATLTAAPRRLSGPMQVHRVLRGWQYRRAGLPKRPDTAASAGRRMRTEPSRRRARQNPHTPTSCRESTATVPRPTRNASALTPRAMPASRAARARARDHRTALAISGLAANASIEFRHQPATLRTAMSAAEVTPSRWRGAFIMVRVAGAASLIPRPDDGARRSTDPSAASVQAATVGGVGCWASHRLSVYHSTRSSPLPRPRSHGLLHCPRGVGPTSANS